MKKIKLAKLTLSQKEIAKLNKDESKRFVTITRFIHDLSMLLKYLLYTKNLRSANQPEVSAKDINIISLLTTLISKIYEMWIFLDEKKILIDCSRFSANLKNIIGEMKKIFSDKDEEGKRNKELFSFIRNKFTFHYDFYNNIDESIDNEFKKIKTYEAWLSMEDSGNEFFTSSNTIIENVIFVKMRELHFEGDDMKLLDKLFELTHKAAGIFRDFSAYYIAEAFSIKWSKQETIDIDAPSISEVSLPLIITR